MRRVAGFCCRRTHRDGAGTRNRDGCATMWRVAGFCCRRTHRDGAGTRNRDGCATMRRVAGFCCRRTHRDGAGTRNRDGCATMRDGCATGMNPTAELEGVSVRPGQDEWLTAGRFALVLGLMLLATFPGVIFGQATFIIRD